MSLWQLFSTLIPSVDNMEIQDYYQAAGLVLSGKWPYQDFAWEYPPAGLWIFTVLKTISQNSETFRNLYVSSLFICWIFLWYLIYRYGVKRLSWPRPWLQLTFAFAAIYFGLTANKTFINPDVWTALLCLGFFLNLRSRPVLASFFLGIATALRLYPVIWLPLLMSPELCEWRGTFAKFNLANGFKPSQWLKSIFVFSLPILLSLLIWRPTTVLIPFIKTVVVGQLTRPIQVESLSASLMVMDHYVNGAPLQLSWQPNFRSLNLEWASSPGWWSFLKLIIWIPLGVAVWVLGKWLSSFRRTPESMVGSNPRAEAKFKTWDLTPTMDPDVHRDDDKSGKSLAYLRVANLLILGLLLKHSVFSPQYLIWLWVPFSLWLIEESSVNKFPKFEVMTMFAIHGLTAWSLWYLLPGNYLILQQFNSWFYWLVIGRNLLIVGLFWMVYGRGRPFVETLESNVSTTAGQRT